MVNNLINSLILVVRNIEVHLAASGLEKLKHSSINMQVNILFAQQ